MRAKEFITEYMNYNPTQIKAENPEVPLETGTARINYLLQKGEARDFDHALKIVSTELACEHDLDPVAISLRLKEIM